MIDKHSKTANHCRSSFISRHNIMSVHVCTNLVTYWGGKDNMLVKKDDLYTYSFTLNLLNFLNGIIHLSFFGTVQYHFRDNKPTVYSMDRLHGCAC